MSQRKRRRTRELGTCSEACPRLIAAYSIATYSGTIDMGLALRWTSQSGMDAWLHRVMYFSFLLLAEDNGLITSCAPSTLINRECEFHFSYLCSEGTPINQVFAQHMRLFLVTMGNTSVEFVMGLEKWIVPIVTRSATTSDGEHRNSLAAEEGDYVEASERYSCALEIRIDVNLHGKAVEKAKLMYLVGKCIEMMVLPLELLQQFKRTDFPNQLEYEAWEKRKLKILEAWQKRKLKKLISGALEKPIETGKQTEKMKGLRTTLDIGKGHLFGLSQERSRCNTGQAIIQDGGKAIIQEMTPFESAGVMDSLVKTWLGTRLDRLRKLVDRNLQEEVMELGMNFCSSVDMSAILAAKLMKKLGLRMCANIAIDGLCVLKERLFIKKKWECKTDYAQKRNREVQQEKYSVGLIIYAGCSLVTFPVIPAYFYFISFQ
ncbi:hypothetical protein RHSIM_Rhsim09G0089900 [Rhododendron simsii]|uniref:Uncharacterized protein n=1 Tax=Rhododendron simsii TaxID=118357 RepID=A0A834GDF5_RHOSS|nr:hypothetical protein RHSIM_Rhsim09G0089900 [Rhododendron simsii]